MASSFLSRKFKLQAFVALLLFAQTIGATAFVSDKRENSRPGVFRHQLLPVSYNEATIRRCFLLSSKRPSTKEREKAEFDSLDIILDRARKRNRLPLILGKCQAALNKRVFPFLSFGEVLLVLAAIFLLDAKGFAAGLLFGKLTLSQLRKMMIRQENGGTGITRLLDFYPVVLAIALDQMW